MQNRTARLISSTAAARMLQLSADGLEQLCLKGIIKKHKVSDTLFQYDFSQIDAYRKKPLAQASPPLQNTAGQQPPRPQILLPNSGETLEAQYQSIAQGVILRKQIETELHVEEFRPIERNVLGYMYETPLYSRGNSGSYALYKPAGVTLAAPESGMPLLYVKNFDRPAALREMQGGLNNELKLLVSETKYERAKSVIVNLLDLTLYDSDANVLNGLQDTIEIIVSAVSKNQSIATNLLTLIELNTRVIAHSVRAMALVLKFCIKNNYSLPDTKLLCSSALLHDIGRTLLPENLVSPKIETLSTGDRLLYESHSQIGYELLKMIGVKEKAILSGALEHHERLDGHGFPGAKKKLSFIGQLIGIVDAYDFMRTACDETGQTISPLAALKLLKQDCESGYFSRELFEGFVYCLL